MARYIALFRYHGTQLVSSTVYTNTSKQNSSHYSKQYTMILNNLHLKLQVLFWTGTVQNHRDIKTVHKYTINKTRVK